MTDPLSSSPPPPIPLSFDGDTYYLDVLPHASGVLLDRVLKFAGNQNVSPTLERFVDLPQATRAAIVQQINRKYPGKQVFIQ